VDYLYEILHDIVAVQTTHILSDLKKRITCSLSDWLHLLSINDFVKSYAVQILVSEWYSCVSVTSYWTTLWCFRLQPLHNISKSLVLSHVVQLLVCIEVNLTTLILIHNCCLCSNYCFHDFRRCPQVCPR
jgi:uncharacterized membrane protein YhfC